MNNATQLAVQLVGEIRQNPWLLAFVAGFAAGWHTARRSTRYMLGGKL